MAQRQRAFVIGIWVVAIGIIFNWQFPQHLSAASIAYVQGNSGGYTAVTSLTVPFASANTAGNLIVVTARVSAQGRTWTIGDTRGNAYILARQFNSSSDPNADLRVYYAYNIASGANTVSLSISGAAARVAATVREYAGFGTTNPLDQSAAAEGSGANLSSGALTTTATNELLVGFGTSSNQTTFGAGSGFGNLVENGIGRIASQDQIVGSVGSYTSTMTISPAYGWASMLVSFKASGSGADTTPPVISNVQAINVSATSASISWVTNEASDSKVDFVSLCPTTGCSTPINPALTTNHSVSVSGLTANSTYTYNVKSKDASGNLATSSNYTFTTGSTSSGGYPIKLSASKTYLLDHDDRPTIINGDTAWSVIVQLTKQDAELYLTDRANKGYNLILVNLLEHWFSDNAPANLYGDEPFTTPGNFTTPNEAYFAHADWVINKAAEKGITVLLTPLYLGFNQNQGWQNEVQNNSLAAMRSYGRYVGNRYKNFPNIIWVIGGDTDPTPYSAKVLEFVAGIKDYDTTHLMTAHTVPEHGTVDYWPNQPWLDLNNIYTYVNSHPLALSEYNRTPFKPFFMLETYYEREHSSTPFMLRRQAYWSILSGGLLGHIFGNCPMWHFTTNTGNYFCSTAPWQGQLDSVGSTNLAYVGKLFQSREFHKLVPDQNHTVVTAGYQSGNTLATTARTSNGSTIISFIPTQRAVTVDMSKISGGGQAQAWWYNPRTNGATAAGVFATTGTQNFTPPDSSDWLLVIDDAALNLPAPGSGPIQPPPPTGDTTPPTVSVSAPANGATVSGSTSITANASDNVGVAGVQFRLDGANFGSEDTIAPYTVTWNTTASSNGTHTVMAIARDAAGNVTNSSTISVTVNNAPPPDTTPPTVSVSSPAGGATVSGALSVSANAADNVGVVGVQFKLDNANLGSEDLSSPHSVMWDTTTASNGTHTLTAVARDAAGNVTTSTSVSVTVNNAPPADTTPPTVSISSPAGGATVSSSLSVSANAADNIGVVGVQFKLDGANLGSEDTTSPYSVTWNTTTATNGTHTLTAVARDAAGNSTTSSVVSVTVNNTTPPPTAISYVQGNIGSYTAVTSLTVAFTSANTAGSLIVVTARTSAQNRTWTISDTRGNTYYLARQFNSVDEANADLRVYYAYNVAAGANTVSLSISGAATRVGLSVREYRGFGAANPLDQSAAASGSSAFLNSGTVSTTAANELIIGFGTTSNTSTFTAGSGFNNLLQNFAGRLASQDRIVSSAGTYNSTMSISPAFGWSSMVVTFK